MNGQLTEHGSGQRSWFGIQKNGSFVGSLCINSVQVGFAAWSDVRYSCAYFAVLAVSVEDPWPPGFSAKLFNIVHPWQVVMSCLLDMFVQAFPGIQSLFKPG